MPVLKTIIDKASDRYKKNYQANSILLNDLNKKLDSARNTGSEKTIAKFKKLGKLLTRERIEKLLDPASPFLEFSPLAAIGLYDDQFIGASCVTGVAGAV